MRPGGGAVLLITGDGRDIRDTASQPRDTTQISRAGGGRHITAGRQLSSFLTIAVLAAAEVHKKDKLTSCFKALHFLFF